MTIAKGIYIQYSNDDTIGLSELLEKCEKEAVDKGPCGSSGNLKIYEFEDGSSILHYPINNEIVLVPF